MTGWNCSNNAPEISKKIFAAAYIITTCGEEATGGCLHCRTRKWGGERTSACMKEQSIEIYYATKSFSIFSPPSPLEASGRAIVLISQRLDRVKMSPRDVLRIPPPRASRYFSGILGEYLSRSFCLTTTPLARRPKARAATLSPPMHGELELLLG